MTADDPNNLRDELLNSPDLPAELSKLADAVEQPKPTWRERRAAERTDKAEANLEQTEQKIHELADQVREDLKGSA